MLWVVTICIQNTGWLQLSPVCGLTNGNRLVCYPATAAHLTSCTADVAPQVKPAVSYAGSSVTTLDFLADTYSNRNQGELQRVLQAGLHPGHNVSHQPIVNSPEQRL
jgi:hypothetical protein